MGRPPTKAVIFKDGFYIQVRNKGASSGIKIRSNDNETMLESANEYRKSKEVIVLGEFKKGVWLSEQAASLNKGKSKSKIKSKAK